MSYKALINSNVNKAFNLIKDLAEEVVLNKTVTSDFNFTSGDVKSTVSAISTKAVITDSNKESEKHNVMKKIALLKTQDIGDISAYSSIVLNGNNWQIGPLIKSDNFVTVVEIYKEV